MASTQTIKEGQAEICLPADKVFYNPVQEFNRDLSIAVLSVFSQDYRAEKYERMKKKGKEEVQSELEIEVTILEALSATGLRSIRYAKEIPNVTKIVANDISEQAVETIKANVVYNQVESLVETSHDDACMLMYKHKQPSQRFSAIDLDPYGCPSIFLDSAVQSIQDGGLLLVTATDMAVLAGNSPETCYCKYGAVSLRTKSCHEMALRILLQCIESHANRYSRYIVPLLSISADFYIRVFVKIYSGALQCKQTTSKLAMVYNCVGCDSITLQPLGGFKPNPSEKNPAQTKAFLPHAPVVGEKCANCGANHRLGGPIWSAPLHDQTFVSRVLDHVHQNPRFGTAARIDGVLSVVSEEIESPLYYTLDKLFGTVHCETMPMLLFRSAILNAGYEVSYSHASEISIKTNAPSTLVWDIVRVWETTHTVKDKWKKEDPVTGCILSRAASSAVNLTEHSGGNPRSRRAGCLRYQRNPAPRWGPAHRPRSAADPNDPKTLKSVLNQNKKSRNRHPDGKRQHSPTEDESRKKPSVDIEQSTV